MRILVLQESDWVEVGPHQSHHLMERLSLRGHVVEVIDFEIRWRSKPSDSLFSPRKRIRGFHKTMECPGVGITTPPFLRIPILDLASIPFSHKTELDRKLRDFKPDAIIGFGIINAYLGLKAAKRHGIPFVYYIIDELHRLLPNRELQGTAKLIESYNMRHADAVLSINEQLRDYTIDLGAKREQTVVIRAGVDLEKFSNSNGSEIRSSIGANDDDVVLFFMGWLYDFSGLKEAVEEFISYPDNRLKMLIVGKGDLWEELTRLIEEHGLQDRVVLWGWQDYDKLPDIIKAADICMLPAHANKIMMNIVPIKMYEYLASGKPVIATRLNGLMAEFGENSGVIYIDKSGDVLSTASRLIDTGEYKIRCEQALEFTEGLDWNDLTDAFESKLRDLSRT